MFSETSSFMPNMQQLGGNKEMFSETSSFMPNMQQLGGNKEMVNANNDMDINTNDINRLLKMLEAETESSSTSQLEKQLQESLKQNGGRNNNINVNDIKSFFLDLKSQGVNVNVKLDNKSLSEFFNMHTTTDISDMFVDKNNQLGGATNPGFTAFLDLKKFIAKKFNISVGPVAQKIASTIQKEMKEKHKGLDSVSIAKEGMKHFEKNMDDYRKMLKK